MASSVLWQWAKDNGLTMEDLAERLGYESPRYVEQVARGWEKMSPAFIGRFVQAFPNDSAFLLVAVSEENDIVSDKNNGGNHAEN